MRRSISILGSILSAVLCAGTGGGSGNPPQTYPNIAGAWEIATPNNGATLFVNFTQTDGTFFATDANIAYCDAQNEGNCNYSWGYGGDEQYSINGTVTTDGTVQFTLSSLSAEGQYSGTITTAGGVTQMSGTLSANYNGGYDGAWQATQQTQPATGTYVGSWSPLNANITMALTQGSNGAVTGAATATGTGCFTGLTLPGFSVGGGFFLTDSTGSAEVYGVMKGTGIPVPSSSNSWFVEYQIVSGPCKGGSGYGTFTRM